MDDSARHSVEDNIPNSIPFYPSSDEDNDQKIPRLESKASILAQTSSVAFNNLLSAINMAAQAKMLSLLDEKSAGSGALTSTFQTVFLSAFVGCLLSIGIEMGEPMGKVKVEFTKENPNEQFILEEYKKAGEIARSGWILSFGFGLVTTGLMCITIPLFPYIADEDTAKAAGQFFLGSAIGAIPSVMARTIPQIAFQAGDLNVPIIGAILLYIPSIAAGYYLSFHEDMGALGIGLGNSLVAWLSYAIIHASFLRKHYQPLHLFRISTPQLCNKLCALINKGWELGLQRLSEWGNLAIITTWIGAINHNAYVEATPAVQYITILSLGMQGFAQGSGMLIKKNTAGVNEALKDGKLEIAQKCYEDNKKVLIRNNILGTVTGGIGAAAIYAAKKPLCDLFLHPNSDQETRDAAQSLLWVAMLGLLSDAPRTICLGALRGWKQVFRPTMASLIIMTGIGAPLAYGLSRIWGNEENEIFFGTRDIAMLAAAFVAAKQCYNELRDQLNKIQVPKNISNSDNSQIFFHPSINRGDTQSQQVASGQNAGIFTKFRQLIGW